MCDWLLYRCTSVLLQVKPLLVLFCVGMQQQQPQQDPDITAVLLFCCTVYVQVQPLVVYYCVGSVVLLGTQQQQEPDIITALLYCCTAAGAAAAGGVPCGLCCTAWHAAAA